MSFFYKGSVDVCVITTIHAEYDARIYERGLQALVDAGFSVCLVSPWRRPEKPWIDHKWVTLSPPLKRSHRIIHGLKTFLAALKQPAKSYHFHDIDFLLWGTLLHLIKNIPVVYDCHENYPEEIRYGKLWIPSFLRSLLSIIAKKCEDIAVRIIKYCVVVVPYQEDRFSCLGAHTVLVRNFANWPARRDLSHDHAVICTGSLSPSYGVYILIEIAREIKKAGLKIPLILADRFESNELKKDVLAIIEKEDLKVSVHPRVLPNEMDFLLSKGCIALAVEQDSPQKRIAYPTKLFEYMAMGLPIIASDLPYTKELVEKVGCGVTVTSNKAKAYVDAINSMLKNPEKMNRYRENGFKAVENNYNWFRERNKLVSLFEKLLQKKLN